MRLFELDQQDSILKKLIVLSNQLEGDLEAGKLDHRVSIDDFLKYLAKNEIVIDKKQLIDMSQKPLMKKLIKNIEGDTVVFVGDNSEDGSADKSQQEKIVADMAKSAANIK